MSETVDMGYYVAAKSVFQWADQARRAVETMEAKGFANIDAAGDDPLVGELVEAWYALGADVDPKLVAKWLRPVEEILDADELGGGSLRGQSIEHYILDETADYGRWEDYVDENGYA